MTDKVADQPLPLSIAGWKRWRLADTYSLETFIRLLCRVDPEWVASKGQGIDLIPDGRMMLTLALESVEDKVLTFIDDAGWLQSSVSYPRTHARYSKAKLFAWAAAKEFEVPKELGAPAARRDDQPPEAPEEPRIATTNALLLVTMAVSHYGYRPWGTSDGTARKLSASAKRHGLGVSDDTVGRRLDGAWGRLTPEQKKAVEAAAEKAPKKTAGAPT